MISRSLFLILVKIVYYARSQSYLESETCAYKSSLFIGKIEVTPCLYMRQISERGDDYEIIHALNDCEMSVPCNTTDKDMFTATCQGGSWIVNKPCPSTSTCPPSTFRCSNDQCIPLVRKCDGIRDCWDGSDEINDQCKTWYCIPGDFKCKYSGNCVPYRYLCDHRIDCPDGSDESYETCRDIPCDEMTPYFQLKCGTSVDKVPCASHNDILTCDRNDYCLSMRYVCDTLPDCKNGVDEVYCKWDSWSCSKTQFRCANNQCIPISSACDMFHDCLDGSDEDVETCANTLRCFGQGFRCDTGQCVPYNSVCDMKYDCEDGSDEKLESCQMELDGCFPRERQMEGSNEDDRGVTCPSGQCAHHSEFCAVLPVDLTRGAFNLDHTYIF